MLSEIEYIALKERVVKGKEVLDGKWDSEDSEIKRWIGLWFELSDSLLTEEIARGTFNDFANWPKIRQSAEEKIQRIKDMSKQKGRRVTAGKSNSTHLFATSI